MPTTSLSRRGLFRAAGTVALGSAIGVPLTGCGGDDAHAQPAPGDPYALPAKAPFAGLGDTIYLDSAANHPWPAPVADAVADYARAKTTGSASAESALARFARLINAQPDEVTYTPSTSMGEYLVTQALGLPAPGARIVTDALHFTGSFYMYEQYAKQGADVAMVRMSPDHGIAMADLDRAITPGTRLVAVSHVSLYNGFEHDLKALCDLAHSRGALVYVDLIQSAGTVPVDVKAAGVDFAACGTYKWLMGDFGLAFLYVRKDLLGQLRRPWLGYLQTSGFVSPLTRLYPLDPPGEPPFESRQNDTVAGFFNGSFPPRPVEAAASAGMAWIEQVGLARIQAHRQPLVDAVRTGMTQRGFRCVTPEGSRTPIVTFAYPDAARLASRLTPAKIRITLRANHIRVSPSVFNDGADIARLLDAIGTA